jgi:hypothetical protein
LNKKDLSERGICTKYINPTVQVADWDTTTRVAMPEINQAALSGFLAAVRPSQNNTASSPGWIELISLCDRLEGTSRYR